MTIIQEKTSIRYIDGFKTYDALVNYGDKKHYRIQHSDSEFAKGKNYVNGIKNFWFF